MEIKGKTIGTGKPLLCVPVMESNKEEIIDELRTLAKSEADVVEWRIDVFADYKNYNAVREVFAAAAECMKEKIFLYTFRTKKQGGMGELTSDELSDLHDLAAEAGCVDLLDLEFFEEEHPARKIRKLHKQGLKVIASHHDFYETPDREDVYKRQLQKAEDGNKKYVILFSDGEPSDSNDKMETEASAAVSYTHLKLLRQNKSGNVQGIAQVHQDIAEQNPAGAFLSSIVRVGSTERTSDVQ